MPHLPDHVTHDPELIAAYAAGDAAGPALDEATELVAGCPECAELHRDLRAISTALPELPAPVRPRDFRLTPEQADSLRPAGWRGVLAAFASPRFRLAAPLGAGLAAAGLAGLLLASPGGLLLRSSGGATAAEAPVAQGDQASPTSKQGISPDGGNLGGAALAAPEVASPAAASALAAGGTAGDGGVATELPAPAAGGAGPSAAASSLPDTQFAAGVPAASAQRDFAAIAASASPGGTRLGDTVMSAPSTASTPWLVASGVLVLVGLALVALRVASRRIG